MIFSDLIDRTAQYVDRSDLNSKIENWVNDTRRDLALKYDFNYLYTEATCETSAGSGRYALPSDYLGHLSVFIGTKKLMRLSGNEFDTLDGTEIDLTREDQMTPYLPTTGSQRQDEPDYYVDRGMEFDLEPQPDATYTLTIKYYAQPTLFTAGTDYDYITTFHPEAVIFGAALRAAMYLDDQTKIQTFTSAYNGAITEMIKNEKDKFSKDRSVRMKSWKDFTPEQLQRMLKVSIT